MGEITSEEATLFTWPARGVNPTWAARRRIYIRHVRHVP